MCSRSSIPRILGRWTLHMQATPFFDKIVFSKVKERLGGRVKIIVSGGAPLAGGSPALHADSSEIPRLHGEDG